MFKVISLRKQGAVVNVVQRGKNLQVTLHGMGATDSDMMTPDMKLQQQHEFIKVIQVGPALTETKETPVAPAHTATDVPHEPPVVEPKKKAAAVWKEVELQDMKKKELLELAEVAGVVIPSSATKLELIDAILLAKIEK